jgi:septal ring factor EnvC (AmiA/AmiB activator)
MSAAAILKAIGIRGGLAIGFAIAFGITAWRADVISGERDVLQTWQDDVSAATRLAAGTPDLDRDDVAEQIGFLGESVGTLKDAIDTLNADAIARAAELEQSQRDAAREAAMFERAARESDRRISRLTAIASAAQSSGTCEVPEELLDNLEGL